MVTKQEEIPSRDSDTIIQSLITSIHKILQFFYFAFWYRLLLKYCYKECKYFSKISIDTNYSYKDKYSITSIHKILQFFYFAFWYRLLLKYCYKECKYFSKISIDTNLHFRRQSPYILLQVRTTTALLHTATNISHKKSQQTSTCNVVTNLTKTIHHKRSLVTNPVHGNVCHAINFCTRSTSKRSSE